MDGEQTIETQLQEFFTEAKSPEGEQSTGTGIERINFKEPTPVEVAKKFHCNTCGANFNDPVYHRKHNPAHEVVRTEDGQVVGRKGRPLLGDLTSETLETTKSRFFCLTCKLGVGDQGYHRAHHGQGHRIVRVATGKEIVPGSRRRKAVTRNVKWQQTPRGRAILLANAAKGRAALAAKMAAQKRAEAREGTNGHGKPRHKILSVLGSTVGQGQVPMGVSGGSAEFQRGFAAGYAYHAQLTAFVQTFAADKNIPMQTLAGAMAAVEAASGRKE